MTIERRLRNWAHAAGLQNVGFVVALYRGLQKVLNKNNWDKPVEFRGSKFVIGQDLSLYPAVKNGAFESLELDSLIPRVETSSLIWDVGANIGIYSVLLAKAAPEGHVIAFEPVPDSQARWKLNTELNDVTNATLERTAMSKESGTAFMTINDDAHGCDSINLSNLPLNSKNLLQVNTIRGDDYAKASVLGDPDVIKVDIEGHEPEFFEGCWELISRRRPLIMMEINPTTWTSEERRVVWQQILDRLLGLYKEAHWFEPRGSKKIDSIDVTELGSHAYNLILIDGK